MPTAPGRKLRTTVHVPRGEEGHFDGSVVFGPDDDVPEWAAARITNPKAWADYREPSGEPS